MKNDIFISYSRHDTNVVNEIVNMLEQEGYSVWIDRDGIESGEDFKRVILKAIKESEVILFFSSEHSNVSDWTAKEIGVAVKYRKHTIPIKLDDSNFNEAVEFDLINLDYIDYSKATIRPAMREKLLKTLRNKLGPGSKEIERLEAERKAKEAAERERLESERKAEQQRAEAKAEEARRKAEQERLERERAEAQRKAQLAQADPKTPSPKPKKILWIGIGAAAALALLLVLLLKPKKDPAPTDPDTLAFQACQTVADYRDYVRDYGRSALHYADARSFVDKYVADSVAKAQQLLAQQQAQQQAEADAKAQAEAEKKEDKAYAKCTTVDGCDSYLKTYPNGRYVAQVRTKKSELEQKQTQQQAMQNKPTVGSVTSGSGVSGSTRSADGHEFDAKKEEDEKTEIFQIVEEMPSFPGGEQKLIEFLGKNVKYPQLARETGIQGRVFVSFVVESDGSITNVSILRGIGGGCDEEAVRVVKSMPKWNPAKCRGKGVRCSMQIPIVFRLN